MGHRDLPRSVAPRRNTKVKRARSLTRRAWARSHAAVRQDGRASDRRAGLLASAARATILMRAPRALDVGEAQGRRQVPSTMRLRGPGRMRSSGRASIMGM